MGIFVAGRIVRRGTGHFFAVLHLMPVTAVVTYPLGERRFSCGATAQTPGSANDLGGVQLFHGADGAQVLPKRAIEVVVFFLFVGLDAVFLCEEAERDGPFTVK